MRIGPLGLWNTPALVLGRPRGLFFEPSLVGWPAGGDPVTEALLGGGTIEGGTIELVGPSLTPGGTAPSGDPAVLFNPSPGQTMTVTGPWIEAPANGTRNPNPRVRYAFGKCRDTAGTGGGAGSDPPSGPKPLKYILNARNTASGTGHKDLAMAEPRFSAANAGGSPVTVFTNSGIIGVGTYAWGSPPNPGSYGTAGCGNSCPGWVGGCRNTWHEHSMALSVNAGGAGERVSYQHVLQVTQACMVQLVVNTP